MFCRDHPEAAALDSARGTARAEPSELEGTLTRSSISAVVKVGNTAGRYSPEEVAMSAQIRGPASTSLST